ncbi:MAG: hypothetical protein JW797_10815 [Bradymonadales bacterium]|nr:hypothetical protein [Bradymonadales bacterium]
MSRQFGGNRGRFGFWLVSGLLVAVTGSTLALAHILPETRQLVLSVEPTRCQLLVTYELPAGQMARDYRLMVDMNHDGQVSGGVERWAVAMALLPRMQAGLSLLIDGQAVPLELENVSFQDGAGSGHRRGFAGMALLVANFAEPLTGPTEIRLRLSSGSSHVHVQAQVAEGLTLSDSSQPVQPDAPVIGPTHLDPGIDLVLTVQPAEPVQPAESDG